MVCKTGYYALLKNGEEDQFVDCSLKCSDALGANVTSCVAHEDDTNKKTLVNADTVQC